jgi:hypothetical protein
LIARPPDYGEANSTDPIDGIGKPTPQTEEFAGPETGPHLLVPLYGGIGKQEDRTVVLKAGHRKSCLSIDRVSTRDRVALSVNDGRHEAECRCERQ